MSFPWLPMAALLGSCWLCICPITSYFLLIVADDSVFANKGLGTQKNRCKPKVNRPATAAYAARRRHTNPEPQSLDFQRNSAYLTVRRQSFAEPKSVRVRVMPAR